MSGHLIFIELSGSASSQHQREFLSLFEREENLQYEPLKLPLKARDLEDLWAEATQESVSDRFSRSFLIRESRGQTIGLLQLRGPYTATDSQRISVEASFFLDMEHFTRANTSSVVLQVVSNVFNYAAGSERTASLLGSTTHASLNGPAIDQVCFVSKMSNALLPQSLLHLKLPITLTTVERSPIAVYFIQRQAFERRKATEATEATDNDTPLDMTALKPNRVISKARPGAWDPFSQEYLSESRALSTGDFTLEPVDLSQQSQYAELQDQRSICGWHYEDETIRAWQRDITSPISSPERISMLDQSMPHKWFTFIRLTAPGVRVGHVSYDTLPGDPHSVHINHLFIKPEYQSAGLARRVMDLLETRARQDPDVQRVKLTSADWRYYGLNTYEWSGSHFRLGERRRRSGDGEIDGDKSTERWYARRGYKVVSRKEMYRYEYVTGMNILLWGVEMEMDVC